MSAAPLGLGGRGGRRKGVVSNDTTAATHGLQAVEEHHHFLAAAFFFPFFAGTSSGAAFFFFAIARGNGEQRCKALVAARVGPCGNAKNPGALPTACRTHLIGLS